MDQPLLPAGGQAAGGNDRLEHRLIAQRHVKLFARQARSQDRDGIADGARVGACHIGFAEILDAGLVEFIGPFPPLAEDLAEIGVTLRRAGGGFDMA